ncbi:MAG: hypothetical protein ACR2QR_12530 [Woeseiaceae bacterium]
MTREFLRVLDCDFVVDFDSVRAHRFILACYSRFIVAEARQPSGLTRVSITRTTDGGWRLSIDDGSIYCRSIADLIYDFEKELTLRIQLRRPELLFVHGAAVASGDRCVVIAGESGAGKSTLCWTLCNEGFTYMSDELAPVSPDGRFVEAYPHAICLKQRPENSYALPDSLVDTGATMHVPAAAIPGPVSSAARQLSAIVFIEARSSGHPSRDLSRISVAEAAARLYSNALNQLAHDRAGLRAVLGIVNDTPAFTLCRSDPSRMSALIGDVMAKGCKAA